MFIAIVKGNFVKDIHFNKDGDITNVVLTTHQEEAQKISVDKFESCRKNLNNYYKDGSCEIIAIGNTSEINSETHIIDAGNETWDVN